MKHRFSDAAATKPGLVWPVVAAFSTAAIATAAVVVGKRLRLLLKSAAGLKLRHRKILEMVIDAMPPSGIVSAPLI